MDYCGHLRNAVISPLIQHGPEGVQDAVKSMTAYDLLREDLESLQELSQWPGSKDPMSQVDSKVSSMPIISQHNIFFIDNETKA